MSNRLAARGGGLRAALAIALAVALGAPGDRVHADPADDGDLVARDADYAAGRQAIKAKNWADAVARLRQAEKRHPDDADLQNDLGYAYRNLGQLEPAFRHYKQALALDPRHRGAHEYIGEAYLIAGDVASAERHLEALRKICLLPCEELTDLQKAIAAYRAR